MAIPDELAKSADAAKKSGPQQITARNLLLWYGFARRGANKVSRIRKDLKKLGVKTDPDFDAVWVDVPINLMPVETKQHDSGKGQGKSQRRSASDFC